MDLAKEVMTELSALDLSGAKVTNIKYLPNETRISFMIEEIEVSITARNATEYAITSIVYQEQVFNDRHTLSQYDAWVKFVLSKVYAIIESKRSEAAEVAYKANVEMLHPKEDAVIGTGKNISSERLEEAEARGRKEGFKAARKTNAKELSALKKKYNVVISVIVVLLTSIFVATLIFMNLETGVTIPEPLTDREAVSDNENVIPLEAVDHQKTDEESEQINDFNHAKETILVELGETFEYDELEITIGTQVEWDIIENEFFELNGAAVFRLPITITNQSEVPRKFDMFSFMQFTPIGERLYSISSFFINNGIDWSDDIRPNDTQEAYMYFLYDGDGEYTIVFDNHSESIKIVFDIQQES